MQTTSAKKCSEQGESPCAQGESPRRRAGRGHWSPEDDQRLRDLCAAGAKAKDLAKAFPHRTLLAVRDRRRKLGLAGEPQAFWSAEETETLKKLWGEGVPGGKIAKQLQRTRNAVLGRVFRLRLSRSSAPEAPKPMRAQPYRPGIDPRPVL